MKSSKPRVCFPNKAIFRLRGFAAFNELKHCESATVVFYTEIQNKIQCELIAELKTSKLALGSLKAVKPRSRNKASL